MVSRNQYTIALDFDGTLVTHRYPHIGEELPEAVEVVKRLIAEGHRIILWSVREGQLLQEAVQWCEERGITFYAVNKNYPEEQPTDKYYSRKLQADIFIDDRSLGGLPPWQAIYQAISTGRPLQTIAYSTNISEEHQKMMSRYQTKPRKSPWPFGRK